MNRICVYCSSNGQHQSPAFVAAAEELGRLLVQQKIELVYGGGNVGLMGVLANTVLEQGGTVIGVIPKFMMPFEVAHRGVTELHIVETMHERKQKMLDFADACIAMPGGLGTMEEIFEALSWSQLRLHAKPCGFLNVDGFYDHLLSFLKQAVEARVIHHETHAAILHDKTPMGLLAKIRGPEDKFISAHVAI